MAYPQPQYDPFEPTARGGSGGFPPALGAFLVLLAVSVALVSAYLVVGNANPGAGAASDAGTTTTVVPPTSAWDAPQDDEFAEDQIEGSDESAPDDSAGESGALDPDAEREPAMPQAPIDDPSIGNDPGQDADGEVDEPSVPANPGPADKPVVGGTGSTGDGGHDVTLLNARTGIMDLSKFSGRAVVLWRFDRACTDCESLLKTVHRDYEKFNKKLGSKAVFIAVGAGDGSPEEAKANATWLDERGFQNANAATQRVLALGEPGTPACTHDLHAKYFAKSENCTSNSHFIGITPGGEWEELGDATGADFVKWASKQ